MKRALQYTKSNAHPKQDTTYVLKNYLRMIRWKPEGNDSIIDVGCGAGDVTTTILLPSLPSNIGKLMAADISEEMIEYAKSQHRKSKVEYCTLDISSKNIRPDLLGQFDHLFSFYCLHWIQDHRQAFTNIYNLLKPEGDMLVNFLTSHPFFLIYEKLSVKGKWMKYMLDTNRYIPPYQNCKDPGRLITPLLDDIGFARQFFTVMEGMYVLSNLQELRNLIIAVNPFLGKIPNELHDDYLTDFISEVRNLNYIKSIGDQKQVQMPYKLAVIVAGKVL